MPHICVQRLIINFEAARISYRRAGKALRVRSIYRLQIQRYSLGHSTAQSNFRRRMIQLPTSVRNKSPDLTLSHPKDRRFLTDIPDPNFHMTKPIPNKTVHRDFISWTRRQVCFISLLIPYLWFNLRLVTYIRDENILKRRQDTDWLLL
jgi:hypothetical protein